MILDYVTGNPEVIAAAHYPENPHKPYKPIYYKALNSTVNASKDRFYQPTFKLFTQPKQLFLKAVGKQDVSKYWRHISKVTMMSTHSNDPRLWAHQFRRNSQSIKVVVSRKTQVGREFRYCRRNYLDCRC